MMARSPICSHDFILTSAPAVFDVAGSSLGHGFPDFANTNWQAALMTEEQRLAYNVRQLGVTGAAEYERSETERRAKKKACK